MRTILFAGAISTITNLVILYAFIPLAIAFQPTIVFQIAFWTFFASTGATVTMIVLQNITPNPIPVFVILAIIVFLLSLVLIYLHMGILRDFPPSLLVTAVHAINAMHIADSLIISGFVIKFVR